MRTKLIAEAIAGLLPIAVLLTMMACAGTLARSNALLPAMRDAWASMRTQAEREAQASERTELAAPQIAKADEGLAADDVVKIGAVDWALLDELVDMDITRRLGKGELGPIPAGSLRERLRLFVESRNLYLRRQP